MPENKRSATFDIDGYKITATFADNQNPAVIGQVKQILLSSFADHGKHKPGDILVRPPEQRYNIDGGRQHHVP